MRSAGFPFELLESLAVQQSRDLLNQQIQQDSLWPGNNTVQPGNDTVKGVHEDCCELEAHVRRNRPAKEIDTQLPIELSQVFESDVRRIRRTLLDIFSNPEIQEALFLSNREAWSRICSTLLKGIDNGLNAKSRQRVRLAWNYLQRFCAKNETHSFFGPIAWAEVKANSPRLTVIRGEGPWIARRRVFFEHWAVQVLANAISEDAEVLSYLPLTLHPACRISKDVLFVSSKRSLRLSDIAACTLMTVLSDMEHHRSTEQELVDSVAKKLACDKEAVSESVGQLIAQGVLCRRIYIPAADNEPARRLDDVLSRLPPTCGAKARWRSRIHELDELKRTFESASLDERVDIAAKMDAVFEQSTDCSVRRAQGRMYVGRYLIYEDCERNVGFVLGQSLIQEIEPVISLLMDLFHWLAITAAEKLQCLYLQEFHRIDGSQSRSIDFVTFFSRICGLETSPIIESLRLMLIAAWRSVIERRDNEAEVNLLESDLRSVLSNLPAPSHPERCEPLGCNVHSPDMMILARDLQSIRHGSYCVLLSEVHPALHAVSQPVAMHFSPHHKHICDEVNELLAPGRIILADSPVNYQRSHMNWPICDNLCEVVPPKCASRAAACRQIPAGQGIVVEEQGILKFVDIASNRQDDLLNVMPSRWQRILLELTRNVLGYPIRSRIMCDRVMIKRRTWVFSASELPIAQRPAENAIEYSKFWHWAKQQGLPRHVFARIDGEEKPFFLDIENPLAVDSFQKVIKSHPANIEISEMRPSPDELWFSDERGHFTCEFRTTWWRSRSTSSYAS